MIEASSVSFALTPQPLVCKSDIDAAISQEECCA